MEHIVEDVKWRPKNQLAANRANAQKSTGPRTDAGKQVSRANAIKHGLQAELLLLPGESEEEFETLCQRVFGELKPVGVLEERIAEEIASAFWRLKRSRLVETGLYARMEDRYYFNDLTYESDLVLALGTAFRNESVDKDVIGKFIRYQKSIEQGLYRAMDKLKQLQKERDGAQEDGLIDAEYTIEKVTKVCGPELHLTF